VCDEALKEIGMQMIESRDCALDPNPGGEPWWVILTPSLFSLFRLQFTTVGYYFMNIVLTFMEMIRLAPKGSGKVRALPQGAQPILTIGLLPLTRLPFTYGQVREMLRRGQEGLTLGGAAGTFTPMYLVHASKPSKPSKPAQPAQE
jgi:sterol 24-C-methyltransferase